MKKRSTAKLLYALTIIILLKGLTAVGSGAEIQTVNSENSSVQDSLQIQKQIDNIKQLQAALESGRPTLAFFYYSVACSCTAARCAIAAAAIDSIPKLKASSISLNYISIDAYLAPAAESLFNLMIMPAVVYYDRTGLEISRQEWGTNREMIVKLIEHPEVIQQPLD